MMNRILACVCLSAALSAGAFVVTQDGKAASEIIIDATAEKPVVNAAAELRHWVKEISGAEQNIIRCKAKRTEALDVVQLTARWQNEKSAWVCVQDNRDFFVPQSAPGKWYQYEGVVIVPNGASQMVLQLGSRQNDGCILFDDAEVYKLK